jgi:hypothetical protein
LALVVVVAPTTTYPTIPTYVGTYVCTYVHLRRYVRKCVRAYVKLLILVVVPVLHLSMMCVPEESVEAESFPFLKVGSYDTYLWYWRVLTPQAITFDPEGVRP